MQLAQRAGHVRGAGEPEAVGQPEQQHDDGRHHADRDHRHLPLLGQGDRLAAAGDRVDDHEQPGEHDDEVEPPAEHRGDDDRGRVDRHAGGEAALQQEEAGAEQAGLLVEPLAEELVGGVDVEPAVHGQEHGGHDDERQRQAEVVLHEADAALEALAGSERNVIALACVAITLRPIVPQPVDALPRRYVLRLRTWRVRQEPYAAMPTMVPSSTTQSATFTRRSP